MDFGIALPTAADSWKQAKRAEELGFTHAWFYDTQMLSADCFVAMGAAAVNTRRIRLGTGVLVPSNRIAPVAANALASLNSLAPGRIDFGVGTGFTARRAMGFGAIKIKDMEAYIHQVYGLGGKPDRWKARAAIRFLNPELDLFNTRIRSPPSPAFAAPAPHRQAEGRLIDSSATSRPASAKSGDARAGEGRHAWAICGHRLALGCAAGRRARGLRAPWHRLAVRR